MSNDRLLLERILHTPDLARSVARLEPEILERVIQRCGLEACGGLIALFTPQQLTRVLDLDLWSAARPGLDEAFDADRFGVWVEVLMESGAETAAATVARMDPDVVIAGLTHHLRVFDIAAVSLDPDPGDHLTSEVGGYLLVAKRSDAWDAIVGLLLRLDSERADVFHRLIRGCRKLSNAGFESDGLHDLLSHDEQDLFDLSVDREERREQQGYATPAQARAFLHMSRQPQANAHAPAANPIARAYFRAIEPEPPTDPLPADTPASAAPLVDLLLEAGVITPPPRALLAGETAPVSRLGRITAHLERAPHAEELAYLANTLVAGCSIQDRPFTPREAADAVLAVCNLGLENGTAGDAEPDLVRVFQTGWRVLYGEVAMDTAEELIGALADLRSDDPDLRDGLKSLRRELTRHWRAGEPWLAREALDVLMPLDMLAWATLLGLIAPCPVIHAAMGASPGSGKRSVSASDFEFIAENSQIAAARTFTRSLRILLRP